MFIELFEIQCDVVLAVHAFLHDVVDQDYDFLDLVLF